MENLATASTEAPALGRSPTERRNTRDGMTDGATVIIDTAGRGIKRCLNPVMYAWDGNDGRQAARRRCAYCEPCLRWKRGVRIARTLAETKVARRTWFHTFTVGWTNYVQWLKDNRDPRYWELSVCDDATAIQRWYDVETQRCKANQAKRLRRTGCQFRQSTNWERHESEKRHAHGFIHETGEPIVWLQLVASSFIMPKGSRRPKRRKAEGDHAYWKRHVAKLYEGWREWQTLRDDPSESARRRRLRLPVQPSRAGKAELNLCRDNRRKRANGKRALAYATKAAKYSIKDGGRWSASAGYGTGRYPWQQPEEGAEAPKGGAAKQGTQTPAASRIVTERCRGAALRQESGPSDRSQTSPRPPTTGPPVPALTTLPTYRCADGSSFHREWSRATPERLDTTPTLGEAQ